MHTWALNRNEHRRRGFSSAQRACAHNVCKPMRKMEPQRAPKRWKLAHEVLHCRVEKTWFFCLPLSDPLCIVLGFSGVAPGTSLFSSPAARRRLFFGITANPAASECPAPSLSLSLHLFVLSLVCPMCYLLQRGILCAAQAPPPVRRWQ